MNIPSVYKIFCSLKLTSSDLFIFRFVLFFDKICFQHFNILLATLSGLCFERSLNCVKCHPFRFITGLNVFSSDSSSTLKRSFISFLFKKYLRDLINLA